MSIAINYTFSFIKTIMFCFILCRVRGLVLGCELLDFAFDGASTFGIVPAYGCNLLLDFLECDEECGHYEYLENHADEHTAYGAYAEGVVAVGAYTGGEHQGQQADDESQRGH